MSYGVDLPGSLPSAFSQVCCRIGACIEIARSTMASISGTLQRLSASNLSNADHGTVPNAAIKLLQAETGITGAQIHGAIGPRGKPPHGPHDSIVFLAQIVGSWMIVGRITLRQDEPLDSQTVGATDQHLHSLLGRVARRRVEMAVAVPDPETWVVLRRSGTRRFRIGQCQRAKGTK